MKAPTGTRQQAHAFTLVELLVVVAIIAVLSSISIPAISKIQDSRRNAAVKKEAAKAREDYSIDREANRPIFDQIDFDLTLKTTNHQLGLEVYSRYQLSCVGEIEFSNPSTGSNQVALAIPFPRGTLEAWDVFLHLPDGTEPADVTYNEKGIFWRIQLGQGEKVSAKVAFTALGREQFEYMLPPAHRLKSVRLNLDTRDIPLHSIPDYALQPTAAKSGQFTWEFNNLVSDRHLIVELPGAQSPTSRLAVLFRFIGLAVLLFGAGFWYLSEQHQPGALNGFRWSHFLLLATIYSLFFVIFSVIVARGEIPLIPAIIISSAASLPLLVLHVSRIIDRRFAIYHILPMAVLTLGIVIAGVYGGGARDYIFIAFLVIGVAYMTITYKPHHADSDNGSVPQPT
ncbi:MAG: prepilin-type N-terminal cleavage/methylation domain-containing protein [Pseudoalteromonas tetraodonis]|jgi:prepilin-type N-terminal cleavage/methylation domain-containing protein